MKPSVFWGVVDYIKEVTSGQDPRHGALSVASELGDLIAIARIILSEFGEDILSTFESSFHSAQFQEFDLSYWEDPCPYQLRDNCIDE